MQFFFLLLPFLFFRLFPCTEELRSSTSSVFLSTYCRNSSPNCCSNNLSTISTSSMICSSTYVLAIIRGTWLLKNYLYLYRINPFFRKEWNISLWTFTVLSKEISFTFEQICIGINNAAIFHYYNNNILIISFFNYAFWVHFFVIIWLINSSYYEGINYYDTKK